MHSKGGGYCNPENGSAHIIKRLLNDFLQWVYDVEFVDIGMARRKLRYQASFYVFKMRVLLKKQKRGNVQLKTNNVC
jgi:hypothetical protein